ncbi:lytic transglycosylase domain-containing protein [Ravibacter arvi]
MLRYAVLICLSLLLMGHISKKAIALMDDLGDKTTEGGTVAPDSTLATEKPLIDTTMLAIDFCGDRIPLREPHVARRYHAAVKHFNHPTYQQYKKQVAGDLKIISKILKQYNLPRDLKYIPLVESNFTSFAVSPRGAVGYWQFMPQTAIALGLRVDETIDERTDLVKSTHAAARYLKWLYGEMGNWTLAAAAFNSGPGKMIKQMGLQKKNNFYHLRLNSETSKYVYKIVAVKELFNSPERSSNWVDAGFLASLSAYHRSISPTGKNVLNKTAAVALAN